MIQELPIGRHPISRLWNSSVLMLKLFTDTFFPIARNVPLLPLKADVILTEEKGTDVNLAVHLLNDAWLNAYDCAVVVSNDSDLAEAMRLAKGRGKLIGWMVTGNQHPSQVLAKIAHFRKPIRNFSLANSQMPEAIPNSTIRKPSGW